MHFAQSPVYLLVNNELFDPLMIKFLDSVRFCMFMTIYVVRVLYFEFVESYFMKLKPISCMINLEDNVNAVIVTPYKRVNAGHGV